MVEGFIEEGPQLKEWFERKIQELKTWCQKIS